MTRENGVQPSTACKKHIQQILKKKSLFVKPADQGSAIGISHVRTWAQFVKALRKAFRVSDKVLVEEFVPGKELTVGILGSTALPVIQIVPEHDFYDFHSKYAKGGSRHILPAPISKKSAVLARKLALKAFRSLGCTVYGRADFLLRKNGSMVALEVNTIPGMTSTSLLPEAARAVGIGFDDLVLRIIDLSLNEKKK